MDAALIALPSLSSDSDNHIPSTARPGTPARSKRARIHWIESGLPTSDAHPSTLAELITEETLPHFTNMFTQSRGEQLVNHGAVKSRFTTRGLIGATVDEHEPRIRTEAGRIGFSCTCDARKDRGLCMHAVALAVAWLNTRAREAELALFKPWLESLDRKALRRLVLGELCERGLSETAYGEARRWAAQQQSVSHAGRVRAVRRAPTRATQCETPAGAATVGQEAGEA